MKNAFLFVAIVLVFIVAAVFKKQQILTLKEIFTNTTGQKLRYLQRESIIAVLIIISPFIFYSYMYFPNVEVWKTPYFTVTSHYFESIQIFMWIFFQKFVFLYLIVIWYLTSKDWWNKVLFIPIGMLIYQIINVFNDEMSFLGETINAIAVLPLIIGVCYLLIKIRNKLELLNLKDVIDVQIKKTKEELEERTKIAVFKKQQILILKEIFTNITRQKLEYLQKRSIIAILIIISPFIVYSYLYFPKIEVWETSFFTLTSHYFPNVYTFMWVFLQKFVFIYLLIIWFLTCKNWWNKAILVPIVMLIYQLINLFNDDIILKEEELDGIVVFPLIIIICYLLIEIKNKLTFNIEINAFKEFFKNEKSKEEIQKVHIKR